MDELIYKKHTKRNETFSSFTLFCTMEWKCFLLYVRCIFVSDEILPLRCWRCVRRMPQEYEKWWALEIFLLCFLSVTADIIECSSSLSSVVITSSAYLAHLWNFEHQKIILQPRWKSKNYVLPFLHRQSAEEKIKLDFFFRTRISHFPLLHTSSCSGAFSNFTSSQTHIIPGSFIIFLCSFANLVFSSVDDDEPSREFQFSNLPNFWSLSPTGFGALS